MFQLHLTFQDACQARNLLSDNTEWINCMTEAEGYQMPEQFRQLFANILLYCECSNATELWNTFKQGLAEDLIRKYHDEHTGIVFAFRRINAILSQFVTNTPPYRPYSLQLDFGVIGVIILHTTLKC